MGGWTRDFLCLTSLLAKVLPVCWPLSGGCSLLSMLENRLSTSTRAGLLGVLQCCSPSRLVKVSVF